MWGTIIPAAASVLGGILGGKGSSGSQTVTREPWAAQAPYLTAGFGNAQNLLNQKQNTPWYQGPMTAAWNPTQQAGVDYTTGFAATGMPQAGAAMGAAGTGYGAAGSFVGNAGNAVAAAGTDKTQTILGNAAKYASSPELQAQIDAAQNDVKRTFNEETLPGINRAAVAGGNVNSSRTGVAEGIARRGAEDQAAKIAAGMRSNAWNNGLQMAQGQLNTDAQLGLAANSQLGQAWQLGNQSLNSGTQSGINIASSVGAAGGQMNEQEQRTIDGERYRWERNDNRPWEQLNNYWGIVGSKDWGGTTTQTGNSGSNWLGGAISGGMAGMGAYNYLRNNTNWFTPTFGGYAAGARSANALGPSTYG